MEKMGSDPYRTRFFICLANGGCQSTSRGSAVVLTLGRASTCILAVDSNLRSFILPKMDVLQATASRVEFYKRRSTARRPDGLSARNY